MRDSHLSFSNYIREDEIEPAVEVIVDWCASHQPLGKKIIHIDLRQIRLEHPIEPPPEDLENYFRPVREKVKAKLEQIKKQQSEKNG